MVLRSCKEHVSLELEEHDSDLTLPLCDQSKRISELQVPWLYKLHLGLCWDI